MSFCWPGPIAKRTGNPSASKTAWSLVPKLPREPGFQRPPFYAARGGLGLSADDGRIDRKPFEVGIGGHCLEQTVKHTHLDPTIITSFGGLIRTEPLLGQVAPAGSRACHP